MRASIMLAVALFFNVVATFVHAGEEIPLFGFVAGAIAALLLARLVFLGMRGARLWRGLACGVVFVAMLPVLTVGTGLVVYDIASGETGTALFPYLVVAEGLYLSVVPESAYYRSRHRNENAFHTRLVRALRSCDEHRVKSTLEDALAGHGGELYGAIDFFSRTVLTRFVDEEWCSEELRRFVQQRAGTWIDQVRFPERGS
ncbi:MAG TPA: hypothetical protein VF406_09535 [Thermodesulfobacteriota bacterium]